MDAETARYYQENAKAVAGRYEAVESPVATCCIGDAHLVKPHGRVALSLPLSRGEWLVEQRDASGRLFEGYTAHEIQLLFERLGFRSIGRWNSDDALARAGTTWYTLLLELQATSSLRSIDQIECVLNRDRKVAT